MPHLIRVYIRQVAIGFALSAVFVALIMYANVANLWHLVTHSPGGWLALVMLWIFNGIVFAGVQFALALPSSREEDQDGGRHEPASLHLAEPIAVRHSEPTTSRR